MTTLDDTAAMTIVAASHAPSRASSAADWLRARAGLALSLGSFVFVVAIGGADGGYFPTAWGWCVLGSAWVAAIALIVSAHIAVGRLELAFLTSLVLVIGWTGLSIFWSSDVEQSVLEVQRGLVYLTAALAAVLVVRRGSVAHLLSGLLAGIVWLSSQALATRLFPALGPESAQITLDRLADPVSYFNALGLLAVMGALLALGFAVHGRRLAGRAAAAAALPVLLTTAYFTYSRGAALALALGLVAAVALDRRRLTFLTTGLLVGLPSAAAVWLASGAPGLTGASASRAVIADEGQDLAIILIALSAGAAAMALLAGTIERRVRVPRGARRAYATVLGFVALGLIVGAVIAHGGPGELARTAYHAVDEKPVSVAGDSTDLNRRLGSIGSEQRVASWRVALRQHEQHPWVGSGAGTHEQFWLRNRPSNVQVRDAHSLYLETLADLGWPGLALVVIVLALPLAGALRARRHPLAAGAFGAYVAYAIHAGVDWDWEMPVITLLALFCAVALIAARGDGSARRWAMPSGWRALGVAATVAVAVFSMIGLVGNRALAEAARNVDFGDFRAGEADARTAARWAPWSAEAHQQLGRAQAGLGKEAQGRASLLDATRMNPADWRNWYELGIASSGGERERAFARAATLNPREEDIEVLRQQGHRLPPASAPR